MTVLEYVLLVAVVLLVLIDIALVLWINRIAAVVVTLLPRVDAVERRLATKQSDPVENFKCL